MLIGYGRVSTAGQSADHQVDALLRAGVAREHIHVDVASGAKASRPQLDVVQHKLRDGDVLVITRLDRLSRSVLHLVTLGAELRERGVDLRVLEQGIDTSTAEGRAMYGMLSVLAELQRELIVANTRDGLAAARARGRKGGRRPRLTPDQAALAQQLYDAREKSVQAIADLFGVPRSTVYGHLVRTPKAGTAVAAPPVIEASGGAPAAAEVSRSAPSVTLDEQGQDELAAVLDRLPPGAVTRPEPDVARYDVLLPSRRKPTVGADTGDDQGEDTAVGASTRAPAVGGGRRPRTVDLSGELGAGWQLVAQDDGLGQGTWQLQRDGVMVGVVRRETTLRGRRGWLARLDTGVDLPARGELAAPGSALWRTRDLAAAAIAQHVATHPPRRLTRGVGR